MDNDLKNKLRKFLDELNEETATSDVYVIGMKS